MTTQWIDAGASADLATAGYLLVDTDFAVLRVARVGADLYAFEDRCTHDGAPLDDAEIDADDAAGPAVVCPRHGARFCLRNGAALTPPAYEPLRVFRARERAGRIEIALE
jgi:3-phenylpropionate/trans-cinnamate dioxygenase ferredoxin subunit